MVMPWSEREVFSITPVIAGAGRGLGSILAGVALIGVAIASSGAGLFAGGSLGFGSTAAAGAATLGGSLAVAAGNIGIGLVFMGIAQSISPQPQVSDLDESVQLESFTFSNVVNTSRQGMPVPIAYGRVFVGSATISSGLDVDEVSA